MKQDTKLSEEVLRQYVVANKYMIYLMKCALHEMKPEDKPEGCTWEQVFECSEKNNIEGLVCYAIMMLDKLPSKDIYDKFTMRVNTITYRQLMMTEERRCVTDKLTKEGISLLPFKGDNLAKYYPKPGMRKMSDNDILYGIVEENEMGYKIKGDTKEEQKLTIKKARSIMSDCMKKLGYEVECSCGKDDICEKPPMYIFEMHRDLMDAESPHFDYYSNPWEKAIKKEDFPYEYYFSLEDEYIYMLAHEYKHYSGRGCGVRNISDIYVYLKANNDKLNWKYIDEEMDKLNLKSFERSMKQLAFNTLEKDGEISKAEEEELLYMCKCGTYGVYKNELKRKLDKIAESKGSDLKAAKRHYYFRRFFPEDDFYKENFPFFYKHKMLRPFFTIYRSVKGVIFNFDGVLNELKNILKIN